MFLAKVINKVLFSSTAFTLLLFSSIPAFAQPGGPQEGDPVAIYKQAGINAEQEATIRKYAEEYDQASTAKLQSLGTMLHQLRNMAYQPKLDGTALLAKQNEINQIQSDMALQRIKLLIKIRSTLTTAQNEKLSSILQEKARAEAAGMQ